MRAQTLAEVKAGLDGAMIDLAKKIAAGQMSLAEDQQRDLSSARSELDDSKTWMERIEKQRNNLLEFLNSALSQLVVSVNNTFDAMAEREKVHQGILEGRIRLLDGSANDADPVKAGP